MASKEDRTFPKDTPKVPLLKRSIWQIFSFFWAWQTTWESLHSVGNSINLGVGVYVSM